jgi:hypothetical protein
MYKKTKEFLATMTKIFKFQKYYSAHRYLWISGPQAEKY